MNAQTINPEVLELARWMSETAARVRWGDVRATLRIRDGRISLIEREVTEKIKPSEPDEGEEW